MNAHDAAVVPLCGREIRAQLQLEGRALAAVTDHPELSYDDGLREVAVPVLSFNGTGVLSSSLASDMAPPARIGAAKRPASAAGSAG